MHCRLLIAAACGALVLAVVPPASGQNFRVIDPIATPETLPEGATRPSVTAPVAQARIEAAVRSLVDAWNDRSIERLLAPDFYDRDDLGRILGFDVPDDARLTLIALAPSVVLDQYLDGDVRVSLVAVTVDLRLDFIDPLGGPATASGRNALILRLREAVE